MKPTTIETTRKFKEPVVLLSTPARFDATVIHAVLARAPAPPQASTSEAASAAGRVTETMHPRLR